MTVMWQSCKLNLCPLDLWPDMLLAGPSQKHAYIILYSKTEIYRGIHYFSYFAKKYKLWALVRTASSRWF